MNNEERDERIGELADEEYERRKDDLRDAKREYQAQLQAKLARVTEERDHLKKYAESATEVLQNLMSFLSVNGCRTEIDPANTEMRIRDGIDMLVRPVLARAEAAEAELRKAREQEPIGYQFFSEAAEEWIDCDKDAVKLATDKGAKTRGVYADPKPAAPDSNSLEFGGIKPAAPAVTDALRMELEWLEGWLHCMAEPMGQACCKRSMFECCGSPDPVYPDISHIGAAMSKRRNDVIAMLQSAPQSLCHCRQCNPDAAIMILCPICGNKRCPHANDHRNACTGSNEPGQPGSDYPAHDAILQTTGAKP